MASETDRTPTTRQSPSKRVRVMTDRTWTVSSSNRKGLAALFPWQWSCTTQVPRGDETAECQYTGMAFSEELAHRDAAEHARTHPRGESR